MPIRLFFNITALVSCQWVLTKVTDFEYKYAYFKVSWNSSYESCLKGKVSTRQPSSKDSKVCSPQFAVNTISNFFLSELVRFSSSLLSSLRRTEHATIVFLHQPLPPLALHTSLEAERLKWAAGLMSFNSAGCLRKTHQIHPVSPTELLAAAATRSLFKLFFLLEIDDFFKYVLKTASFMKNRWTDCPV